MVDRDLLRRKLTELAEHVIQVSEYRAAKALGLTIPPPILLRADQVIE